MKRAAGILALVVTTLATAVAAAPARADGIYYSESFGGTKFDNELSSYVDAALRLRLALGYRANRVAVEGWVGGDLAGGDQAYDTYDPNGDYYSADNDPSTFTYGLDAKYLFPVRDHVELYVRGSMSRMNIDSNDLPGYAGRGLGVGTGIQLKGKAPLLGLLYPPVLIACLVSDACRQGRLGPNATIAGFVDQGYDFYRLHSVGRHAVDVEATRWTFGIAIGSDF